MLDQYKTIFIVGIKGVAMANLAVMLKSMGKEVSGSDVEEQYPTDRILQQNNIHYRAGFLDASLLSNTDLVVYSAAHGGSENPLVKEAKKRMIPIMHQAQLIGALMKGFPKTIGVCGSHGKTTTASLLSYALIELKKNPSYLVGSTGFNQYFGGAYTRSEYFVVEADEYALEPPKDKTPKFHFLSPAYVIATNIDFDHPDVYADIHEVKKAFMTFFEGKELVLCADDEETMSLLPKLSCKSYETFGYSSQSDMRITGVKPYESHCQFSLSYKEKKLGLFTISLFGKKNVSNTASVILMLFRQGFDVSRIQKAIQGFTGAARRFEQIAYRNNTYFFDDYAHHPAEIASTIQGAKDRFPTRRVIVIFQPHTFSRTIALKDAFAKSLSLADYTLIAPIFASAREKRGDFQITSFDIEKKAQSNGAMHVVSCGSNGQIIEKLHHILQKGDVICTMGAGDIYKLKSDIIEVIGTL